MPDSEIETIESKTSNLVSRTYRGHTIEFHPPDLRFHVLGPEFKSKSLSFPSFDEARAKVDIEVDSTERVRAKNIKFSETILTEDGERQEITAIDRRDAILKGVSGKYVYPNLDVVASVLARKSELQKELNKLNRFLETIHIATVRGYSRIDPEDYPKKIKALQTEINEKTELARTTPDPLSNPSGQNIVNLKSSSN